MHTVFGRRRPVEPPQIPHYKFSPSPGSNYESSRSVFQPESIFEESQQAPTPEEFLQAPAPTVGVLPIAEASNGSRGAGFEQYLVDYNAPANVVPPSSGNPLLTPGEPIPGVIPGTNQAPYGNVTEEVKPPVSRKGGLETIAEIEPQSPDEPKEKTDDVSTEHQKMMEHISTSPTCSLNLVCYRSGVQGCKLRQIQTIYKSRFADDAAFQKALAQQPQLISSDVEFFQTLRKQYLGHMCGFWRRVFFLKTLCGFRLLQVRRHASITPISPHPPMS
jgi:hypothetical protein